MKLAAKCLSFAIPLCLIACTACNRPASKATNQSPRPAATAASSPQRLTTADLQKLKWIEGSWKGTGDVEKPFYERYRFANDSTLVVESFDDEAMSKVTDETKFELNDGQFGNSGDVRWVVTNLDDKSITFSPAAKARNSFIWQYESPDVWKAVLNWPASDTAPAKERVYKMERIK